MAYDPNEGDDFLIVMGLWAFAALLIVVVAVL